MNILVPIGGSSSANEHPGTRKWLSPIAESTLGFPLATSPLQMSDRLSLSDSTPRRKELPS